MVASRVTSLIATSMLLQCLSGYSEECPVEGCARQDDATEVVLLQLASDLKASAQVAALENASRKGCALSTAGGLGRKINLSQIPATDFGVSGCQCIGFDAILGETPIDVGSETVIYPSDLGSSCAPWDKGVHPDCTGQNPPDWCSDSWCFVDACACDLPDDSPPKVSSYMPDAQFRGRQLYYSYTTCGNLDQWTLEHSRTACVNHKDAESCIAADKCEWTLMETCLGKEFVGVGCGDTAEEAIDESIWGQEECRCIGIEGQFGSTEVLLNGSWHAYPGDMGTICKEWDEDRHPDCQGPKECQPSWCFEKWCYVDPCRCHLEIPPKTNTYIPLANYRGKPLYYSYATCGNLDAYTASERSEACVNQETPEACTALDKCTWVLMSTDGWSGCVGKELTMVCDILNPLQGGADRTFQSSVVLLCFAILALALEG